jgi:DNA-binding transcriptional ArsR family regulator
MCSHSTGMCSHFAEEVDIMPFFKENGVSAEDYDIVERFDLEFNADGQPIEFATEVQDVQREILSFLVENPQATASVISQTLEIEIAEVTLALGILEEAGLLALENSIITISPIGEKVSKAIKIPQAKIKYRYEERPNAPALKQGGNLETFVLA